MLFHSNPYHLPVDPVDGECYSPFGDGQLPTVLFYATTFYAALFLLWWKGNALPPLSAVLATLFIVIGIVLNILFCIQLFGHNTSSLDIYTSNGDMWFLIFLPLWNVITGLLILFNIGFHGMNRAAQTAYKNPILNQLNQLLATRLNRPLWLIILFFPVLIICTLILMLFGQDYNSCVKVFTETTTWTFSQQIHPPILDHKGHYLCTVAAKGSPKIVKPIRLGIRGNKTIIVNRQLQIANAFEEWIQDSVPYLHRVIRRNYDKYGYNLSKKINTSLRSDLTYILMKPLEWAFLICLYLFCTKPEEKIDRQYALKNT